MELVALVGRQGPGLGPDPGDNLANLDHLVQTKLGAAALGVPIIGKRVIGGWLEGHLKIDSEVAHEVVNAVVPVPVPDQHTGMGVVLALPFQGFQVRALDHIERVLPVLLLFGCHNLTSFLKRYLSPLF
jgi:hypothetical protein